MKLIIALGIAYELATYDKVVSYTVGAIFGAWAGVLSVIL